MVLPLRSLACFLLLVSAAAAQQAGRVSESTSGTKTLQPWLVGLIAVVGFLFIVFTLLIVKRLFFQNDKPEGDDESSIDGHDNLNLQLEEAGKVSSL
ncbi:Small integral membrane protein 24 [Acipenser ruthenus]|uniref:Small integral membrane protein 24 n=1 Tax=Acipenser ruthenus TaxID=7906 RepID=A0A444U8Y6_ACIRT|nr:small integral membrane protein 24-like [Acipenser ruthenus]RXM31549.1 Small integral membrane protein 24 [Acipenser ruthenus]